MIALKEVKEKKGNFSLSQSGGKKEKRKGYFF